MPGTLTPMFDPQFTEYSASYGLSQSRVAIVATVADGDSSLTINDAPSVSGEPFEVDLALGFNLVTLTVSTTDGRARDYELVLVRDLHLVEQAYLKASVSRQGDRFGNAVALDGDTLAIGTCSEDSAGVGEEGEAEDHGVFVFTRASGVWTEQDHLQASSADPGDQFGCSVALRGDVLAVGAQLEDAASTGINGDQSDNTMRNSGAVYIFRRTGEAWTQRAYLKASNATDHARFGSSLSLDGGTLAVGARGESSSAVDAVQPETSWESSGAVYVFVRSGETWAEQAFIKAPAGGAGDQFGYAIALSGDTLAVSAFDSSGARGVGGDPSDDTVPSSGAVYLFTRANNAWEQDAYIKASNTGPGDIFGSAVALSGETLAVGAAYEDSAARGSNGTQDDNRAVDSGAVYLFFRSQREWTQQSYLKSSNSDTADRFGWALALDGDMLAVGATYESSSKRGVSASQQDNWSDASGAVYLFERTGGVWQEEAYVKSSNADAGDQFGSAIALQGGTLVVAADGEASAGQGFSADPSDNSAAASGAVYVFTLNQ